MIGSTRAWKVQGAGETRSQRAQRAGELESTLITPGGGKDVRAQESESQERPQLLLL